MTKTLVVTGATGFIGRRLVKAARQGGWVVRALANDASVAAMSEPGVAGTVWDIEDPAGHAEVLRGATAVCHLAAFIPPDMRDPAHAERCFRINALGTLQLLQAAVEVGVPHVVHYSSGNCYAPQAGLAVEGDPLYPAKHAPFYLSSKLTSEIFANHFAATCALAVCVLRLAAVYGPGMGPHGLVPTFARQLRAGEPITVTDGGRYTVDLVFVDDVVRNTLAALDRSAQGNFNMGSGQLSSTLEIAHAMVAATHADPALVDVQPAAEGAPPLGFAGLDMTRTTQALGQRPTPLGEGLAAYVASL